jgi:tagatose 1,6-diphosphate aldolase GatY/KbaY
MPVGNAHTLLTRASAGGYGVGAFNVTSLVQFEAAVEAAEEHRSPLILQTSVSTVRFFGANVLVGLFRALAEEASVPVCLHLDHCPDVEFCKTCVDAGYTGVMIDASPLPFEENIRASMTVCDYAHGRGTTTVEGELGTVSGTEDQLKVREDEALLCDPAGAVEFVARTGVDLFAPAVGTAHGVYTTKDPSVDYDRLEGIVRSLRAGSHDTPVVIHGGSGLPDRTVKRLVALGGAKFNVSTDMKHALLDATGTYLSAHRGEYNPLKVDGAVKKAVKETVARWIGVLGSAGRATSADH